MRILPEYGGQSRNQLWHEHEYCAGTPELAVEICLTSTEVDFGTRLELYRRAGVREYLTAQMFGKHLVWRVLQNGYTPVMPSADVVFRSTVFQRSLAGCGGLLGGRRA